MQKHTNVKKAWLSLDLFLRQTANGKTAYDIRHTANWYYARNITRWYNALLLGIETLITRHIWMTPRDCECKSLVHIWILITVSWQQVWSSDYFLRRPIASISCTCSCTCSWLATQDVLICLLTCCVVLAQPKLGQTSSVEQGQD